MSFGLGGPVISWFTSDIYLAVWPHTKKTSSTPSMVQLGVLQQFSPGTDLVSPVYRRHVAVSESRPITFIPMYTPTMFVGWLLAWLQCVLSSLLFFCRFLSVIFYSSVWVLYLHVVFEPGRRTVYSELDYTVAILRNIAMISVHIYYNVPRSTCQPCGSISHDLLLTITCNTGVIC